MRRLVCVLMLALTSLAAQAKEAAPLSNDPALEARVMAVAEELRCLVCQNETIAASHADLAVDLRQQIREQLQQGRTPAQIIDYMVARYGEFVRYRPAFDATTALLWLGPFLLLAVAAFAMWRTIKRRRAEPIGAANPTQLSTAQNQRLRQLLGTESDPI